MHCALHSEHILVVDATDMVGVGLECLTFCRQCSSSSVNSRSLIALHRSTMKTWSESHKPWHTRVYRAEPNLPKQRRMQRKLRRESVKTRRGRRLHDVDLPILPALHPATATTQATSCLARFLTRLQMIPKRRSRRSAAGPNVSHHQIRMTRRKRRARKTTRLVKEARRSRRERRTERIPATKRLLPRALPSKGFMSSHAACVSLVKVFL